MPATNFKQVNMVEPIWMHPITSIKKDGRSLTYQSKDFSLMVNNFPNTHNHEDFIALDIVICIQFIMNIVAVTSFLCFLLKFNDSVYARFTGKSISWQNISIELTVDVPRERMKGGVVHIEHVRKRGVASIVYVHERGRGLQIPRPLHLIGSGIA